MVFRPRTAAAVQPADAPKTPVRVPQGEYEEEMRLPSAGAWGGGGQDKCRRGAKSGRTAIFFFWVLTKMSLRILLTVRHSESRVRAFHK